MDSFKERLGLMAREVADERMYGDAVVPDHVLNFGTLHNCTLGSAIGSLLLGELRANFLSAGLSYKSFN